MCRLGNPTPFSCVNKPGKCVSDYVQVWGNVETIDVGVVPNVAYYRDFFLGNYLNQAFEESGCPNSSR